MAQVPEVETAVARIEQLLDDFGARADGRARAQAEELVRALMEVYGEGLRRIVESLQQAGDGAALVWQRLTDDRLVSSLLVLHGVHPVDAETRIRRVLEVFMRRRGAPRIEFLDVQEGVARIRVEGDPARCGSTAAALKESIAQAVQDAAPELHGVEIAGLEPTALGPLLQIAVGPSR